MRRRAGALSIGCASKGPQGRRRGGCCFVQCPPALAACSALAQLSVAGQGCANVYRDDTLCGPISLDFLAVAKSGERKSQIDKHFGEGVRRYEREQTEILRPKKREYLAALANWDGRTKGNRKRNRLGGEKRQRHGRLGEEAAGSRGDAAHRAPHPTPPLRGCDIRGTCLSAVKGWPAGGIMSSEGGAVFGSHSMQAENVTRCLSLWNGLWSGERHVHSRRTTESFVVEDARLTIHIAVQEEVLRQFFERTGGLAKGMGFLARCLIAYPESTIGTRVYKEPPKGWPQLSRFVRKTEASAVRRAAARPKNRTSRICEAATFTRRQGVLGSLCQRDRTPAGEGWRP